MFWVNLKENLKSEKKSAVFALSSVKNIFRVFLLFVEYGISRLSS